MGDDLQAFLGQLHDDGHLDSDGRFTVAVHALDKLRRYQFTRPQRFVLSLLASAVASGATSFRVQGQADRVQFLHDGQPPERSRLLEVLDLVLSEKASSSRDLALAINGALAIPKAQGRVETWSGQFKAMPSLVRDDLVLGFRKGMGAALWREQGRVGGTPAKAWGRLRSADAGLLPSDPWQEPLDDISARSLAAAGQVKEVGTVLLRGLIRRRLLETKL